MIDVKEYLPIEELREWDYSGPWMWYLLAFYLSLPLIFYIVLPFIFHGGARRGKKSIAIFVLGDLGHSPRMCYHARSFASLDYSVDLCGYLESELAPDLIDHPFIDIHPIPVIKNSYELPFIIFAFQKIILQVYYLFELLFSLRGTDYILIQNPPSIPILLICIIFTKLFSRNTQLIIDWHNLNYSILNLRYKNEKHPMVYVLKLYEKYLGKFADLNFTVSKNMKRYLVNQFGFNSLKIIVLYDRPGDQFSPLDDLEFTEDEIKLHHVFDGIDMTKNYKIIISSTSFTPDEDFNILLEALKLYDKSVMTEPILLIVTGKGPLKEQFLKSVNDAKYLSKVVVKSAWLAIEDYPVIMAIADVGVSLHTSSSGLDLPMKILDFYGCGIPVISLDFPSISELVHDGKNGLICHPNEKSSNSDEIFKLLKTVLLDDKVSKTIKDGALNESKIRWKSNWINTLADIFKY